MIKVFKDRKTKGEVSENLQSNRRVLFCFHFRIISFV